MQIVSFTSLAVKRSGPAPVKAKYWPYNGKFDSNDQHFSPLEENERERAPFDVKSYTISMPF